jgi:hypothetical protein
MLKRLAIPIGAALIVAVILVAGYYQKDDASSQGYDINCVQPSQPTATSASLACVVHSSQNADQSKSSPPWWHKLLAWPDGITAWLLLLTLGAIIWQSWETRKAASSANRGIEVTKTKERAKLLLSPQPLNPTVGAIPEAKLFVTNAGESNALVGAAIAGLHISDSDTLMGNGSGYYAMKVESRLFESRETIEETIWWPAHSLVRYSQDVIDDKAVIHLHGIIRFKDAFDDSWGVNFHFIWRPYGIALWFPHLQAHKYGEWEDRDEKGEYRIQREGKRRWWKFWLRTTPPRKETPPNPN